MVAGGGANRKQPARDRKPKGSRRAGREPFAGAREPVRSPPGGKEKSPRLEPGAVAGA